MMNTDRRRGPDARAFTDWTAQGTQQFADWGGRDWPCNDPDHLKLVALRAQAAAWERYARGELEGRGLPPYDPEAHEVIRRRLAAAERHSERRAAR